MDIREYTSYREEEILPLHASVGWSNYTDRPEMLRGAFEHSLLTLGAYEGEKLVGLIRAVGDGSSALLIQDLLVLPAYQRRGIGRALMTEVMARYPEVYQLQLVTDGTAKNVAFYRSLGLTDAGEWGCKVFMKTQDKLT